jgi:putative peptidoglycan lipid II flippase
MELPHGMFGVSLATYLLPTLSGLAAEKKYPEFRQVLGHGLSHLALANLLAAAIALALAQPIVRLIFEHGKFGPEATQRVSLALACLAPGLLMFSMNNIFARAFYALNDIQTPMKISVFCLAVNLATAFWFLKYFKHSGIGGEVGLALANTMSAAINVSLLTYTLRRKLGRLDFAGLRRSLTLLLSNAVLAGIVAHLLSAYWEQRLGNQTLPLKLGAVFVPGAVAAGFYWLIALWLRVPSAQEITALFMSKFRR